LSLLLLANTEKVCRSIDAKETMFELSFLRIRDLVSAFYCPTCRVGFGDRVTLAIHYRKRHWTNRSATETVRSSGKECQSTLRSEL